MIRTSNVQRSFANAAKVVRIVSKSASHLHAFAVGGNLPVVGVDSISSREWGIGERSRRRWVRGLDGRDVRVWFW